MDKKAYTCDKASEVEYIQVNRFKLFNSQILGCKLRPQWELKIFQRNI